MIVRWLRLFGALAAAVVSTSVIASAANSPTIESTPVPKPPRPDFSSMNFLMGSWTCTEKVSRRPAAYHSTSVTTIDPTGYFMVTKSTQAKTSWVPWTLHFTNSVTYDDDAKRWVTITTGDLGAYDATTSQGWTGNTIVWNDQLFKPGKDVIAITPLTITKVSDTKTTSHTTFQEKSGRWISDDTTCNKSS